MIDSMNSWFSGWALGSCRVMELKLQAQFLLSTVLF